MSKIERKPNSVWVTDFNTDSIKKFYEDFVDIEADPYVQAIPIFINSYGGQVYSLIAKRDLIKTSSKPVCTICLGKAMSCGASLLASGTKGWRFASPDSRILIHQVSSMTLGKASDIKEDAAQVQALNEMMLRNLAEDTGNSVEKLKKEIKNRDNADWTMTSEEAKKWGIIDQIGVPRHVYQQAGTELALYADVKNLKNTKKAGR
jgi:ATP-dependent Clp protease protease subunit